MCFAAKIGLYSLPPLRKPKKYHYGFTIFLSNRRKNYRNRCFPLRRQAAGLLSIAAAGGAQLLYSKRYV